MRLITSLSIFFPSLNDARALPTLIKSADTIAQKLTKKYEIIVVNDGSSDDTPAVVKRLQKRFTKLRIITHPRNLGYGAALISGFAAARYDWIFYTDGDGQYDPTELISLVKLVTPTIDVVNGYKLKRADHWIRTMIGTLYNHYAHAVTHLPIRDVDCDFRLIRRSALQKISLKSHTGTICMELVSKLHVSGSIFAETPVHHYPRLHGTSEFFRFSHILKTLKSIYLSYGP